MLNLINWRPIFLFVILVTAQTMAHALFFDKSPEPSSVKINLSETGVVADFRFEIKKHFPYWFSMEFWFPENDQKERARIRKLLGGHAVDKAGKPIEPGISTPVNLKIFAVCRDGKEIEVYSQDIDPILTSWGQASFSKTIGTHVLTPGTYRARLVNKRIAQELSSVRITFEIGMPAKASFDSNISIAGSGSCQR